MNKKTHVKNVNDDKKEIIINIKQQMSFFDFSFIIVN